MMRYLERTTALTRLRYTHTSRSGRGVFVRLLSLYSR